MDPSIIVDPYVIEETATRLRGELLIPALLRILFLKTLAFE